MYCYEYKILVHALIVDFNQAYDSIDVIIKMYKALRRLNIPSVFEIWNNGG